MLGFSSGNELEHIQENLVPPAEKLHRHESSSWLGYMYSPWSKEGKRGEIVEVHPQQMGEELGSLCAASTATGVPHREILHNAEHSKPLCVSWPHFGSHSLSSLKLKACQYWMCNRDTEF